MAEISNPQVGVGREGCRACGVGACFGSPNRSHAPVVEWQDFYSICTICKRSLRRYTLAELRAKGHGPERLVSSSDRIWPQTRLRPCPEHQSVKVRHEAGGWIAFSALMPSPAYDPKNAGPTHGNILVTNNIRARDRWGKMSHLWLVTMVHTHDEAYTFNGRTVAEAGEITAFSEPGDQPLRGLTHWRPAVLEEWPADRLPAGYAGRLPAEPVTASVEGEG